MSGGIDRRTNNQEMWDRPIASGVFIDVENEDVDGIVTKVYNTAVIRPDGTERIITRKNEGFTLNKIKELLDNVHEKGYSLLITPAGTR